MNFDRAPTNWADEEDDASGHPVDVPPPEITIDEKQGIKNEIRYRYNEQGDLVKDVRVFRLEYRSVTSSIAKRRNWKKFGASRNDPPGPNTSNTYPGEEVFMKFVSNKEEVEQSDDDPLSKINSLMIKCRICGGAHTSSKCPYKDSLASIQEITAKLNWTGEEGQNGEAKGNSEADADLQRGGGSRGLGSSSGSYVPPSLRGNRGGATSGSTTGPTSTADRRRMDDQTTVRVTNLPEDTNENDLVDLFSPFGKIQRVFLAKDKVTSASKGFAFITYGKREDAAKAIQGVSGYGYDHLILKVEWAKPTNN